MKKVPRGVIFLGATNDPLLSKLVALYTLSFLSLRTMGSNPLKVIAGNSLSRNFGKEIFFLKLIDLAMRKKDAVSVTAKTSGIWSFRKI